MATTPHKDKYLLPEFDLGKGKSAFVFGSELPGISEIIMNEADEFLKIPMYGFTESFNISVSAAIVLYELSLQLRKCKDLNWQLTEREKNEIKLKWIKASVKQSHLLEQRFYRENR